MNSILSTYKTALTVYVVVTLPTIILPPMYFLSLIIALILSVPSILMYSLIFYGLAKCKVHLNFKWLLLTILMPVVIGAAYWLMVISEYENMMKEFIAFPMVVTCSVWLSLFLNRKLISEDFEPTPIQFDFELDQTNNSANYLITNA